MAVLHRPARLESAGRHHLNLRTYWLCEVQICHDCHHFQILAQSGHKTLIIPDSAHFPESPTFPILVSSRGHSEVLYRPLYMMSITLGATIGVAINGIAPFSSRDIRPIHSVVRKLLDSPEFLQPFGQQTIQQARTSSSLVELAPRGELIGIAWMTLRHQHHRDPQEALRVRLRELAGSRVRYGHRRLTVLLKWEGWKVNAKRIYRLYTEEGLIVRTQQRKQGAQQQRLPSGQATGKNEKWSIDFVAQRLQMIDGFEC